MQIMFEIVSLALFVRVSLNAADGSCVGDALGAREPAFDAGHKSADLFKLLTAEDELSVLE